MKQLTALAFSAAIIPAFVLSSGALAQFMNDKPAGAMYYRDLIEMTVKHRETGAGIGVIENLIIDEDGRIIAAVITTGNLMGLGGKQVGMHWDQLEHTMEGDDAVYYVGMDKATLWDAPAHERD